MSYVSMRRVLSTGEVKSWETARNNHGFTPLVWDYFAKEVCGWRGTYLMGDEAQLVRVWDLFNSGKLDARQNLLLGATFDRVWVSRENVPAFVEALEWFHRTYIAGKYVETVREMAQKLTEWLKAYPDDLGIALDQCSAIESWWFKSIPVDEEGKHLPEGTPASDVDDYEEVPLNILTDPLCHDDKPHWEVFGAERKLVERR